ncbi:MAG: glycosyltransferase family 4 protein [Phycisphaerales bacterium]|jgi:glycosyltransferase involved in cell wall biosynthesis
MPTHASPAATAPPTPAKTLRVVIQQPAMAKYRVPVFRELARRPGIDLLVAYGNERGITSVEPDGFRGVQIPIHDFKVLGSELRWHKAHYQFVTPKQADVVVLSWSTRYLTLVPSLIRARWNNVGTVLWGHGYSKAETRLRENSRGAVADFADAVLFYNHTSAQRFIDRGYSAPDRVFVALNTLDITAITAAKKEWEGDPARLAAFRAAKGLAGPTVLFVSRLNADNRVDLLLKAAAVLHKDMPALKVVIVGSGPESDSLKALARSLQVEDAIIFTGAIYDEKDLAPYFLSAGVFCYPVNIGLSLIHAMAYGVPVVTSNRMAAQNPEIEAFHDGVNGCCYQDGDVDALAGVLGLVLSDAALQRRLHEGAIATVTEDFNISKMVDGMEAAIRYAASRHQTY